MKHTYFFPLNYHYSAKLFGIIEYKLLIPLSIYGIILYTILSFFTITIFVKTTIFIIFFLPIALLLNSKINSEPFYLFVLAIIKHYVKGKKYLYKRIIWCGINPNCKTNSL